MSISLLLAFWLIFTIAFSFVNTKVFLCSFLAYFLLVPFMDLRFIGLPLGYNAISFICLIGFVFKSGITWHKMDFKPLKPFLVLFLLELLLMPFQSNTPLEFMLYVWLRDVMNYFILPFMLWNAYCKDNTVLKPVLITFVVCIIVICGYGLFLTTIPGVNPYLIVTLPLSGGEFNVNYAYANGADGRIFGRISSVFPHPMTFGLFGSLAFIFIFALRNRFKFYFGYILLSIVALSMLFCGVRSAIVGMTVGIIVYLYMQRQFKLVLTVALLVAVIMYILPSIPGLDKYLVSITDSLQGKSSSVTGSSYEMRLKQLNGAFAVVKDCLIQGMGYDWTQFYQTERGDHPVLLAFESLIFIILCNEGLLGFLFWVVMLSLFIVKVKYPSKEQRIVSIAMIMTYIAYSCVTGDYNYMKYFLIFYIITLMLKLHNNNGDKIRAALA